MKNERIDILLVKKGFYTSREQAKQSIEAGIVFVEGECVKKPSLKVSLSAKINVIGQIHPYVSRGGVKLAEAIDAFKLQLHEKILVDIGASTGGFTDCALQHGAKLVYAVDVGWNQLAKKVREDPRVIVMEGVNFRYIDRKEFPVAPHLATIDVSFISLTHILPPLYPLLLPTGEIIVLIKPQFEAGRKHIGKKGLVKDPNVHFDVLSSFIRQSYEYQLNVKSIIPSPIRGSGGNIEFIGYLVKEKPVILQWKNVLKKVIQNAHMK